MNIDFPKQFKGLFEPYRYKVFHSGRGAAKTTLFAQALLINSLKETCTILCCREFQSSIKNSVHQVFVQEIERLKLNSYFDITYDKITSITGSQFIFAGVFGNIDNIKSIPNISYCWIEEGQRISQRSLDVLIPTIRAPNSEIWISFNPYLETDPVYSEFIINKKPNSLVVKTHFTENPWCPQVLIDEANYCKQTDPDKYDNIWDGNPLKISDSIIFKNKFTVKEFDTPEGIQFYQGLDWGFSNDPAACVRSFIIDRKLYIDYAYAEKGVELDQYGTMLDKIPNSKRNKIYADAAQPGNISLVKRQGYFIEGAKKWPGSIEDGISYLKSFEEIIIHPRAEAAIDEFKKYSYKVNKQTDEILAIPEDKNNHIIDSLRYSLHKEILASGTSLSVWSQLGK